MADVFVIALLVWASFTGLRTLHRHREFFEDFGIDDVFYLRLDALLYMLVTASTILCIIDVLFRTQWIVEIGWANSGERWAARWLIWHASEAMVATGLHCLTDRLLSNKSFCTLCRRPW